ncbi:hypothetical protein [Desulfosporosinus sp. BG]|uniref:hypothetical protein n=1 Tax=Desulfosporosinus sp. BG TaxID=1633135 RepID=UPI00083AB90D|nr:hypothetical protein [Desulfosporosinus sp. BG]ODA43200.1 hypothetical protein DSBG_0196 [Desulfosporosinus sp. BG]
MMEQEPAIKQKDYQRASRLLGRLFEVDSDITEQINRCLQDYGANGFFRNLGTFDFSEDVFEKLKAVRMVLFGMGEEAVPDLQKLEKPEGRAKP